MAETFPVALQDKLNEAGFSQSLGETAIRSSMEIGLDKVRRRYTKRIDTFSCTINLTLSEYSTFNTFFDTTLAGGTKTFNYEHPLSQTTAEFRFTKPPRIAPLGGTYFRVSMEWEEIP